MDARKTTKARGEEHSVIGGKAQSLHELQRAGFSVPAFKTIDAKTVLQLYTDIGVAEKTATLSTHEDNRERLREIREGIEAADLKPFVENILIPLARDLGTKELILRSSAEGEDGGEHSFAGMFESARSGTNAAELIAALKHVLTAAFSDRLAFYLQTRGIDSWPRLAIIIQEFVTGSLSGVLFTTYRQGERFGALVNFTEGTAHAVVHEGSAASVFVPNKATEKDERSIEKHNAMTSRRLAKLIESGKNIEALCKKPQDIEWTLRGEELFILQSRPITAARKNIRVWDNSNIAENYTGVVLPLTASFCQEIYRVVYHDVARTSGVSEEKIREHEQVFGNLLGFFYGRFYYNMLNWYTMLTLFPGYERNRKNLEHMISAKSRAELDERHKRNVSKTFIYRYYARNILRYLRFRKSLETFQRDVRTYFKRIERMDFTSKDEKELIDTYYEFRRELLGKWSITVDNDFLLMTLFGALRALCAKSGIAERDAVALIADIHGVVSADQVEELTRIASQLKTHEPLCTLVADGKYEECFAEMMTQEPYRDLREALEAYKTTYGGRFANELRLEKEPHDIDPKYLVKLLDLYMKRRTPEEHHSEHEAILKRIPFTKRRLARGLVKRVKYHVKKREESRLLRAQAFGNARTIFANIGKRFAERNIIGAEADVFYLRVEEIEQYIEGSSTDTDLKSLIERRKKTYESYAAITIDDVFITEGMPYESYTPRTHGDSPLTRLTGKGCSGGTVTGKVKIVHSCDAAELGEYDIIVARHTDPGWTPLFGLCKGIIVEQGGVLSHAAIISRELQLPCVIQVAHATSTLRDGQTVTINGLTGEITIHAA